jgi:hypothetical protein
MIKSKKNFKIILLVTVLLIFLTRGLTVSHNIELHCDEQVFFNAAQSLKGYIFGSSPFYEEVKEYPEGAIVYQLPIHIFTAVLNRIFDAGITPKLSGRLASVFYFTLGAVLGLVLIYRYFSKKPVYSILYGLTVVFSLLHFDQSRYGTGDAISYFLLIAIVLLTATALSAERRNVFYLLSAVFLSGSLCAVKYPLIFFAVIPLYGLIVLLKGRSGGKKAGLIFAFFVLLYAGFACFSPKAAFDPSYILKTSSRELDSYFLGSSIVSSLFNLPKICRHFTRVFIYSMLYSGFPLFPIFFIAELVHHKKNRSSLDTLLYTLIPILVAIFFTYNLFVPLLFMRAEYPFFFLSEIYAVVFVGRWLSGKGAKRIVSLALTVFMVLRGGYMVYYMVTDNTQERIENLCESSVDENWSKTTIINGFTILPQDIIYYKNIEQTYWDADRFSTPDSMELEPGELFIASSTDYVFDFLRDIVFPQKYAIEYENNPLITFCEINSPYYRGALYPDKYIYCLFGYWIEGTSGFGAEFPPTLVYYRP